MSFGKAKIQRFNEIKACAPSPATYLIELKNKPKGTILQQTDRSSEKTASNFDTVSTQSVPCFRTPVLLKKKGTKVPTQKPLKPKCLINESSEKEALREKIVECENKDVYIRDLTQQLEEINQQICDLKTQKHILDSEKAEYEKTIEGLKTQHETDLSTLKSKLEEKLSEVNDRKLELIQEILLLKNEFEEFRDVHLKQILEVKANCDEFPRLFKKSLEECRLMLEDKEFQLKYKETELNALEQNCIEIQNSHSLEIEKMKKDHLLEIQDMEFEMLKLMHEMQKERDIAACRIKEIEENMQIEILELKNNFKNEKQQIIFDSKNEIEQVQMKLELSNSLLKTEHDQKLQEVELDWKSKLENQQKESAAILKECQAISEYSIIECEIEKNKVISDLQHTTGELKTVLQKYDQLVLSFEDLNKKYSDLETHLATASKELIKTKEELQTELDNKNKQINKIKKENSAYEVTIRHSQTTIEVLTRRLIHSDKDVEQLKKELGQCEAKILEYEQKCLQISSDLKQAQMFNEELEMQYESSIQINRTEINDVGHKLHKKVDDYKKEVSELSRKLDAEKQMKNEIIQQVHDAFDMISRLKIELDNVEILHTQYKFELEQSQNELEDYHMREMDWNIIRDKLEHTIKDLEELLEVRHDEISDLKKKVVQLKETNDSYCQYSDYYQQKIKECESELVETGNIHKKYIEMSGKYDELSQKFEELELENSQNKCRISQLAMDSMRMEEWKEKYCKQEEEYNKLMRKYECSEKDKNAMVHPLKSEESDSERDQLLNRVHQLENELKEVSQKYADLAGHQNNKQKIKHLVDLKTKNEELVQNNTELEAKMKYHLKTIEKLKKENCDLKKCMKKNKLTKEDKENFGSPNRSLNSSRIESPFRDRN
ncbi:unnamed protein product [Phaedon cochleariae]|uniref:Hyaluronan-mediated motility receptor C-terminal domain-containing protein n=1 Tax=Phaedon cochleariae TaxID=80249 RepID=A0A9N9SF67_PHACE|nr:unnamed protein product [Phaedon cochleariae]